MVDQVIIVTNFVAKAFLSIWPYLLITIPLAVVINMSGVSKYIDRAMQARPVTAILLATVVGAFSPFCSCSVIPVIATLLIGGVPLAPVMAFWIASPSMDPEIFFLSVATIGWDLAIWRMIATLSLSLSAGFMTHLIVQQGWLGQSILRHQAGAPGRRVWALLSQGWQRLKRQLVISLSPLNFVVRDTNLAPQTSCCGPADVAASDIWTPVVVTVSGAAAPASSCGITSPLSTDSSCGIQPTSIRQRLLAETWQATTMVAKFMALAFFLEALITLYIPSGWIARLLGHQNPLAIVTAALIGIPVYTSNLTALPLVSGLLAQGMNPGAGLAFLIAGPTTTLPAMAAVWGLTTRRVFALYILYSLVGAIVLGYIYSLVSGFGF